MDTLLALLDRDHLDQTFFLKSLAKELAGAQQAGIRVVLLHGDSPYTDRIMQEGVMREEASSRAARDLNHRLVALLADAGVSAIGLVGRQRGLLTRADGGRQTGSETGHGGNRDGGAIGGTGAPGAFQLNREVWQALPPVPVVALCGLLDDGLADLGALSEDLMADLPARERIVFSNVDALQWSRVPVAEQFERLGSAEGRGEFEAMHVPAELHGLRGYRLVAPGVPGKAALVGGDLRVD